MATYLPRYRAKSRNRHAASDFAKRKHARSEVLSGSANGRCSELLGCWQPPCAWVGGREGFLLVGELSWVFAVHGRGLNGFGR